MKTLRTLSLSALLALGASLLPGVPALAQGDQPMTAGEVRKVDTEQGKITIKHGPIANLEMPPMTMVFRVEDASMLEGVAEGDKVEFVVVDEGGKMIIEALEKAE